MSDLEDKYEIRRKRKAEIQKQYRLQEKILRATGQTRMPKVLPPLRKCTGCKHEFQPLTKFIRFCSDTCPKPCKREWIILIVQ